MKAMAEGEMQPSSVIGSDITITGSIEASADLMIEGKIDGDVRCRNLILGESGLIKGNVFSDRARVSGTVDGTVETGDLAIEATGTVTGEGSYVRLRVATGGVIEGKMKCRREPEQHLKLVDSEAEDRKKA